MGVSTDAKVAFGFPLEEEDSTPEFLRLRNEDAEDPDDERSYTEIDFDDLRCADLGIIRPSTTNYDDPVWPAYWKAKNEALSAHPADLVYHCSDNYRMYFLAVNGTQIVANRGNVKPLSLPIISGEQITAMREWCCKHRIKWQEPKWCLMSDWS